MNHVLRRLATFASLAAIAISFGMGCAEEPEGDRASDLPQTSASVCTDNDADGYGAGCELGPDCDDQDASTFDQCEVEEPVGCTDGDIRDCSVKLRDGEDSGNCFVGVQMCNGSAWGDCVQGFDS